MKTMNKKLKFLESMNITKLEELVSTLRYDYTAKARLLCGLSQGQECRSP